MSSTSEENLLQKTRRAVSSSRSPLRHRGSATVDVESLPSAPSACRLFTVAVLGLSGTERDKGLVGVGKSCLCNRFVRPFEDDYQVEHLSSLSQVDFGGPVVNNDHWLYWGERSVLLDSGAEITFRLIEQTEFVDDESFQPLKGNAAQREPYLKRCTALRLHSPDKLMYICKDQLGVEQDYEQRTLPDGRVSVDGFVCVYDVSSVPSRPAERQGDFFAALLQAVLKTKKPFVVTTTKQDAADPTVCKCLERLLSRREFRSLSTVLESSAHFAVNTDLPFLLLASLIDRICPKPKVVGFADAARRRREIIDVATVAYLKKLRNTVQQSYRWNWSQFCRILQDDPDFEHFCDLCGRVTAQRLFQQYLVELRTLHMQQRRQVELAKLPDALMKLIPDSACCCGKSWEEIVQQIRKVPMYREMFYSPSGGGDEMSNELLGDRLSSDILATADAEACFRKHFAYLEAKSARQKLLSDFSHLLANCSQVTPGKPLADVRLFLMGKEPFESLAEVDLQAVYDQYQRVLIKRARRDFIELLLENVSVFVGLLQHHRPATGGADLADCDYRYIHDCLQEDSRYRVMNRLHQWRDNAVHKFCHFLSHPSSANCPFKSRCADSVVGRRLAGKVLRNDAADVVNSYYNIFYPIVDCQVKLLIVGAEPLVHQMHRDFEAALTGSLFDYENTVVSVNFKCVSDREFSRFFSYVNEYEANGVIAAYSSKQSFNCVRDFVLHTLLDVDVVRASGEGSVTVANRDSLGRLPVLILYACDPSHLEDMPFLQQQGCSFAESLGVQFVGLQQSPDDFHSAVLQEQKSFSMLTVEQVYRSISWLTHSAYVQYPGGGRISGREELPRPTARVLVCLMCGDDFDADLVVNPLVCKAARTQATVFSESLCTGQHQQQQGVADALTSSVWSLCLNGGIGDRRFLMGDDDKEACTVQLDMFLPRVCHRFHVACTITSYHYAIALTLKGLLVDGYILVYSPKRRASLANLDCVSRLLPSQTPTAFVAVGEVVDFFDAESNSLITEGAQLADQRNARFVSISRNSEASSGVYTPFFEDVWTTKANAGKSRSSLGSSSEQSRSQQDGDAKESEYMTLSSFWSGSSSLPIVVDSAQASARVTNGGQQRKADVAESVNNLFAKRFNESILGESNEKRSFIVDKPVLIRQRQQCSSSSSALLANGTQVPVVPPRRRVGDVGPQEQRRSAVGRSVGDCRVETDVGVGRTTFEASAPLATPESVEIPSDSWITKSMQQLDEIPLRKTAADQKISYQDSDDGCSHGSETAPPVRRKSLIGGPSIAERVRQLTSVLEVSSSSDAGVRSVPGTPTLHGQRERGDTVKSPFFFKTFVLPFRSSSEEYLTDQTDFVYFKGNGAGGGGGGCSGGGVRVIAESVQRIPCGGVSESHILPSTNLSTATAAASVSSPNFFVRKVASSFRIRKKKVADESKSLPQSPTADDRVFVLPSIRTPPREKRLSGDISAANALVNATTMLVSSRLMPANAAHRGLKVAEKSGKEKKAMKEQVGRRLASQVSDSVLKLRKSSASGPSGSSAQCKSLVSIETLCTESADDSIPPFVRKCVEFIEKEGLTTEGLYRVPGNHCQVSLIEQKFTERPDVPFDSLEVPVNAVTTALKNFFATLSEPLISCALYKPLIDAMAIEDRDERTRNLRIVFSQLPRANRATLRYFVDHLRCVARHVHTTAMDHRNIAKCLWPTLVRPEFDSFETMAMMTQTLEDLVLVLLDNPSIIDQ